VAGLEPTISCSGGSCDDRCFLRQLDADKGTLSFAKNGGDMRLAFADLPNNVDLYPVVVFYSLNPGEKVKKCDFLYFAQCIMSTMHL
jgi:hypothetical protein